MPKQKSVADLRKFLLSRRTDAPIGQRSNDAPANPAITRIRENLIRQVELFNEAATELVPSWDSDKPDHFALKLAICKATGVQPSYDLGELSCVTADRLVRNAANMKSADAEATLDRVRLAVREVQSAAEQSSAVASLLLSAITEVPMHAKALCAKAKVIHNSHAKQCLATMVDQKLCRLKRGPDGGYFCPKSGKVMSHLT